MYLVAAWLNSSQKAKVVMEQVCGEVCGALNNLTGVVIIRYLVILELTFDVHRLCSLPQSPFD